MVRLDIDVKQLKKAIERLPARERAKLLAEFRETQLDKQWNKVIRKIDKRLKKFPISEQEVQNEIKAYRKQRKSKNA